LIACNYMTAAGGERFDSGRRILRNYERGPLLSS
jgi:hypothetical protein